VRPAVLFACAAVTFADAALAAERKGCQLLTVDEWTIRERYYRPVIDGAINGQKIGILLDTGASRSLIKRRAAEMLKLETTPLQGHRAFGIGGETRVEMAYIKELTLGRKVYKDWHAVVAGESDLAGDVAVLLGDDFFSRGDIEFDLGKNVVRLFQAKQCDGAWLGYWGKDVLAVELESAAKMQVPVQVNGESIVALLDSGATFSKLSLEAARLLGVTPQSPGVIPGGCIVGLGTVRYESWIALFRSFSIGGQVIRDPKLRFAPIWQHMTKEETGSLLRRRLDGLPDMILGADFLRSHRVFIAHSQRRMYFSYTGGTVFPAEPGKPCSAENK
jgi:predicted aspartyl protease